MPGRRNLQRELQQHDASAADRQLETFTNLSRCFPDHALIGQQPILDWLHHLGIRRLNGGRLTWRIVNRWRPHGCPILRGNRVVSVHRAAALTTTHALTAWLLCRPFAAGFLFRTVAVTEQVTPAGQLPHHAQQRAA